MNMPVSVLESRTEPIRILIVEDNPADALMLSQWMSQSSALNFEMRHAMRLSIGIEMLTKEKIDLILLDLVLPDCRGSECVTRMKKIAPHIPILIISEAEDEELAQKAIQLGAQDYLVKGHFDARGLARAAQYAIERHYILEQLKKAQEIEQYLVCYDALTGLVNRELLYDRMERAIPHARRNSEILAVLFVDLDNFKWVNNTAGYAAGDHILKEIARRLQSCTRSNDTVARLGADEFILFLNGISHEHAVVVVAEKILSALSQPVVLDTKEFLCTACIGISLFPRDGKTPETLIRRADVAMGRAKAQGKNSYCFFDSALDAEFFERKELTESLRQALDREEMILYYQPLIAADTGKVTGLEALLRWKHPRFGLIYPEKFIPLAEETGLIKPLGEWVIRTACQQMVTLRKAGIEVDKLAINLSPKQFHDRELPSRVFQLVEETGLPGDRLMIEITESCAMEDVEYTIEALRTFREAGVRIAIDDFGTGYSCLNYLKRFPIDFLKVDRSFVHGIPEDSDDKSIASAIIFLAHNLSLKVTAEGVENRDQLSYLRSLRCDELQGYYFSRPVGFDSLPRILA